MWERCVGNGWGVYHGMSEVQVAARDLTTCLAIQALPWKLTHHGRGTSHALRDARAPPGAREGAARARAVQVDRQVVVKALHDGREGVGRARAVTLDHQGPHVARAPQSDCTEKAPEGERSRRKRKRQQTHRRTRIRPQQHEPWQLLACHSSSYECGTTRREKRVRSAGESTG